MKRRRFKDRVWLERTVLKAVNSSGLFEYPLFGLSRQAIERWRAANSLPAGSVLLAQITEMSKKSELLVDSSRDVFDDEESELTKPLGFQLQSLQSELERAAHNSAQS